MPAKIGMFMTFSNRTVQPNQVALEQPVLQPKKVAIQKQSNTVHSMRSIMRTPRNGCSSCGH